MRADWSLVTPAVGEPVTLSELKAHLRETTNEQNATILQYGSAARHVLEQITNRGFQTQTWRLVQDDFTDVLWLPMAAPLQSVTSITYYDAAGVQQTLATSVYRVDTATEPGRVLLAPDQVWPVVQSDRGQAVTVTYVVGWTSAAAVPPPLKHAIVMLAEHFTQNRGAVQVGVGIGAVALPWSVTALIGPYTVGWREPTRCA